MLHAVRVAEQVPGWLERHPSGKVHSLFARACNLTWGDWLISLVLPEYGMVPGGVAVRLTGEGMWGLLPGEVVHWDRQSQSLVAERTRLDLSVAEIWGNRPPLEAVASPERLKERVTVMAQVARELGRGELVQGLTGGVTSSEGWGPYAWQQIRTLLAGLAAGDTAEVGRSLDRLLGLGEGLTPSCDDLLLGLLATLHYGAVALGPARASAANCLAAEAARRGPAATTPVSANYLRLAARGGFGERLEQAVVSLLARGMVDYRGAAADLIQSGHSSGTDTLIGVLLGATFLIDRD